MVFLNSILEKGHARAVIVTVHTMTAMFDLSAATMMHHEIHDASTTFDYNSSQY
jgi:hypothetical protein